jgi:hypothetical protein
LTAESLQAASLEGRNLFSEIQQCQWPVVLLSAERLASTEIDKILRDETFRENLVLLGIDEAHVLVPWGKDFRQAYRQIPLLRKRLPPHTAIVTVTATLSAGRDFTSLCNELGFKHGRYHCIRLSSERPNVQMIVRELTHTLGGYQFPDILWAFKHGVKTVVYCRTLDLCFRVALYGWRQSPAVVALDNVRLWTSITSPSYNDRTLELFKTREETTTIVASIAFGMGMNVQNISDVINLGLPSTLCNLVQQNGRAGRDLTTGARAWTFVESTILDAVRASDIRSTTTTTPTPRQHKRLEGLDPDLVKILSCHIQDRCLIAGVNLCLSNPGPASNLRCLAADRPYPCSSCIRFEGNATPTTTTITTTTIPPATAPPKDHMLTVPLPPALTKSYRANALQWLNHFAITRWAYKTDVTARHLPHDVLWSGTSIEFILDHFHLLRSRRSLATILPTWKYLESDGDSLFILLEDLNCRFDHNIQLVKKNRAQKAALTRAKNKEARTKNMEPEQPSIPRLVIRVPARPTLTPTSIPTTFCNTVSGSPSSPRAALVPSSAPNAPPSFIWEPPSPRLAYQDILAKRRLHNVGSGENDENRDPKRRRVSYGFDLWYINLPTLSII